MQTTVQFLTKEVPVTVSAMTNIQAKTEKIVAATQPVRFGEFEKPSLISATSIYHLGYVSNSIIDTICC